MMKPLQRALASLHGLWVGDAFGSHFEFDSVDWERPKRTAKSRILPSAIWTYSDDTQMALSVYETLRRFNQILPDKLAASFGGILTFLAAMVRVLKNSYPIYMMVEIGRY
jgi:ADP-ribosylglycohydrolase